MTGGSLGLRSGSYGSLQPAHNNNSIFASASAVDQFTLPISSTLPGVLSSRKNSKMLLTGSREKERRLSSIFKIASRKKVGMLLLLVITGIAVILSLFFFAISKDVGHPAGPETVLGYSDHVLHPVDDSMLSLNYILSPAPITEDKENKTSGSNVKHDTVFNKTLLFQNFHLPPIPLQHPCENFPLPLPPVDPKRRGPRPCDVCYVPVDLAMAYMPAVPSSSPVLKNLDYVTEKTVPVNESNGGSEFGGHPTWQKREDSFDIKESMTLHCGFAKGKKPGQGTGFDIDEPDLLEMEQCHSVVVASAIFGNYDIVQQPSNISEASRTTACFYMFVDEITEASIKNSSNLDNTRKIGIWRLIVVRNLPYEDARRNGKVPKLLLHRLFPNARYSIWIDGKLELVVDPYQILERFLWRNNASLAISRHYRRFDVFEEAEANKAAGKYDNASIDYQIEFYKREGLTHFSSAKYPITSDVPEGCVIIKEHIPISNLFTCLWFNEVDRFTSRDQLSFSTVRDKISLKTNWTPYMFMDCERRNFVVQAYHKDLLLQKLASQDHRQQPSSTKQLPRKPTPDSVPKEPQRKPSADVVPGVATSRSSSSKKRRDRKSGSRRHRSRGAAIARDPNAL